LNNREKKKSKIFNRSLSLDSKRSRRLLSKTSNKKNKENSRLESYRKLLKRDNKSFQLKGKRRLKAKRSLHKRKKSIQKKLESKWRIESIQELIISRLRDNKRTLFYLKLKVKESGS